MLNPSLATSNDHLTSQRLMHERNQLLQRSTLEQLALADRMSMGTRLNVLRQPALASLGATNSIALARFQDSVGLPGSLYHPFSQGPGAGSDAALLQQQRQLLRRERERDSIAAVARSNRAALFAGRPQVGGDDFTASRSITRKGPGNGEKIDKN